MTLQSVGGIKVWNGTAWITSDEATDVVEVVGSTDTSIVSATSVSRVIPASTLAGDLIVAGMFHRSTSTGPSGYTRVGQQAHPAGDPNNANQVAELWTKTAVEADAGATVTFTQSSSGRMNLALLILSAPDGVELEDIETLTHQSTDGDGNHPVPRPTSGGAGRVAVSLSSCTYANTQGSLTSYFPPSRWVGSSTRERPENRLSLAFRFVGAGQLSAGLVCAHPVPGNHSGGEICAIFRPAESGS